MLKEISQFYIGMENIYKVIIQVVLGFIFGTLGAGFFSFYKKRKEAKIDSDIESDRKLKKYSKSLWLVLKELEYRLKHFKDKLEHEKEDDLEKLRFIPNKDTKIDWYAKDGYYITSTLYLFCNLSSWIAIYKKDIVFLEYEKASLSAEFQKIIEELIGAVSDSDQNSIMWYHYYISIGESIVDKEEKLPLSYSEFILKLVDDQKFMQYMNQAFHFLDSLSRKESIDLISGMITNVSNAKNFLEENNSIPVI